MKATMKLRDPEFVGDYINQKIDEFIEKHPEANEELMHEFIKPIQSGIERILFENRAYKQTIEEFNIV